VLDGQGARRTLGRVVAHLGLRLDGRLGWRRTMLHVGRGTLAKVRTARRASASRRTAVIAGPENDAYICLGVSTPSPNFP
jgi:hypothetical protein